MGIIFSTFLIGYVYQEQGALSIFILIEDSVLKSLACTVLCVLTNA